MGFQQASPTPSSQRAASPPSGAASKGRRSSSHSVGSTSPSKSSSGRPSPSRSPGPKKTGNVSKGSTPPGKSLTCAQGPVLATEARSKVRPCGCSRRHSTGHNHTPETPKEAPRRKSRNEASVKASSPVPVPAAKIEEVVDSPHTTTPEKTTNNRYVSTLVWVPRPKPFTYSTTLVVSAQDPAFSEVVCIKGGTCPGNLAEVRKH